MQWGMNLVAPFSLGPGDLRYLIIVVDYFTKWIEEKALAKITMANLPKFFMKNVLAQFGVPQFFVSDNGTKLIDEKFQRMVEELWIKKLFFPVEHP